MNFDLDILKIFKTHKYIALTNKDVREIFRKKYQIDISRSSVGRIFLRLEKMGLIKPELKNKSLAYIFSEMYQTNDLHFDFSDLIKQWQDEIPKGVLYLYLEPQKIQEDIDIILVDKDVTNNFDDASKSSPMIDGGIFLKNNEEYDLVPEEKTISDVTVGWEFVKENFLFNDFNNFIEKIIEKNPNLFINPTKEQEKICNDLRFFRKKANEWKAMINLEEKRKIEIILKNKADNINLSLNNLWATLERIKRII